jgi:hypothetical protein
MLLNDVLMRIASDSISPTLPPTLPCVNEIIYGILRQEVQ